MMSKLGGSRDDPLCAREVDVACQVGITTDLERRKNEWKRERPSLKNWKHISTHYTKTAAQKREIEEAKARGCNYDVGGAGNENATWYVYYFEY